jgi:hypothetical protein
LVLCALQNAIKFTKQGTVRLGVNLLHPIIPLPPPAGSGAVGAQPSAAPSAAATGAGPAPPVPSAVPPTKAAVLKQQQQQQTSTLPRGNSMSAQARSSPAPAASAPPSAQPPLSVGTPGVAHLEFFVEDSGIGIPPEVLTSLFTPFEQGAPSVARYVLCAAVRCCALLPSFCCFTPTRARTTNGLKKQSQKLSTSAAEDNLPRALSLSRSISLCLCV